MKAVILAGGKGTRLSEETANKPKPLVEIGGRPILWHIMKIYSSYGINDFIICLGYKGYMIKEYFFNYGLHNVDITVSTRGGIKFHHVSAEDWRVTLAETGEDTMTGGRVRRIKQYLGDDDAFCLTYGDGVADINIKESIEFHKKHGKLATVSAVRPLSRFGALEIIDGKVEHFIEKPLSEGGLINGGFFILSPKVIDYIDGDETLWEKEPLENLALTGNLMAYNHFGFWQPMDTLRDKNMLEGLWESGAAPWKTWEDIAPPVAS
jgi:glucose-1-phosphate cytidylyltransferase